MLPYHYCVTEAHDIPNEISKAIRIVVEGQPVVVAVTATSSTDQIAVYPLSNK
ncbi:hypothetical protein [uncultured Acinetobacter sp.]|uniref:hypothetical protein n=1 Tax=uncultured Acinetobacter sp. TaxID=165433 RepID=UPI00258C6553|nr:hypothetical protein [uncultured Acinetobacter sp.]